MKVLACIAYSIRLPYIWNKCICLVVSYLIIVIVLLIEYCSNTTHRCIVVADVNTSIILMYTHPQSDTVNWVLYSTKLRKQLHQWRHKINCALLLHVIENVKLHMPYTSRSVYQRLQSMVFRTRCRIWWRHIDNCTITIASRRWRS